MKTREITVSIPLQWPEIPTDHTAMVEQLISKPSSTMAIDDPGSSVLLRQYIPYNVRSERDPDETGYRVNLHWQGEDDPLPTHTIGANGEPTSRDSTDPWRFPDAQYTCLLLVMRENRLGQCDKLVLGAAKLLVTNFAPTPEHDWRKTSVGCFVFGLAWKQAIEERT